MSYLSIEPTVIDEDLVRKAISEQLNPEVSEIAKKEGVDAEQVEYLRLDYKNILKIDNLWIYENIIKLQLDNNIIERIENIHFLKNLQWLDLSFNNITQIEGLDGLSKLTDLTLYNNRISVIENMEDLVQLQVFSIGNNNIQNIESLSYLLKFENVRILNLSGNHVCKLPSYKNYCLAHFKNLKYLDYRLIDEEAIDVARKEFVDSIIAMEEEGKALAAKKDQEKKQQEVDKMHEKAHILHIDKLFDRMFDEDADFKKIVPVAPAIISDLKEEFRAKFEIVVKEMKHFVLKKTNEKTNELFMIQSCIKEVGGESDKLCLQKMEAFHHDKKQSPKEVDEALQTIRERTESLSKYLMGAEMVLVEQFEEVIKEFERNYTELCTSITEFGQSSFARFREIETEYMEKFSECVLSMYERFNKGDIEDVDDEIRDIMSDKDVLMNALNSAHDFRLLKLDHQEDGLMTGVAKDLESVLKQAQKSEIKRNRDRVGEIIAFIRKCHADIDAAEQNSY